MVYESWGMSHEKPLRKCSAQSRPISIGINSCWYHGVTSHEITNWRITNWKKLFLFLTKTSLAETVTNFGYLSGKSLTGKNYLKTWLNGVLQTQPQSYVLIGVATRNPRTKKLDRTQTFWIAKVSKNGPRTTRKAQSQSRKNMIILHRVNDLLKIII